MQSLGRTATRALPVVLVLVLWVGLATAQTFPPLTGRVVDQAGALDASTVQKLTAGLAAHERATSNQVVVVTLRSLEGYEIADYGYRLGRAWGIGQEGRNNGALLIVAPAELGQVAFLDNKNLDAGLGRRRRCRGGARRKDRGRRDVQDNRRPCGTGARGGPREA